MLDRTLQLCGLTRHEFTHMQLTVARALTADSALQLVATSFYTQHRNWLLSFLEQNLLSYAYLELTSLADTVFITLHTPANIAAELDGSFGIEARISLHKAVTNRLYKIEDQLVRMVLREEKL